MKSAGRYWLPQFSLDRPVSVIMMLIALLLVGTIAYLRVPLSLFPSGFENPRLYIWVSYRSSSPREIEDKITRPIEEIVGTISGIEDMESRSYSDHASVRVNFRQNTDMKRAYAEIRDRMDRVLPELPDDVERINVRHWDEADWEIVWMGVGLPDGVDDPHQLVDTNVRPVLQRIQGVANVEIWGSGAKSVSIDLNETRLRKHGISKRDLLQLMRSLNFSISSGYLRERGKKVYLRSMAKFTSLQDIEDIIIDPVRRLTLADVATIKIERPKRDRLARVNRQDALSLGVFRVSGGNIVEISRDVRKAVAELENQPNLAGIDFQIFWDQGEEVTENVNNMRNSGIWGGLLAGGVLFFFLRQVRLTLIITLAIPLSILATLIAIYFVGWTLNSATMMGLMLSLGLVVDNAIVIVENIYRRRQEGLEARRASIEGAGEVGLAVTMATLTTVVVFLPLILMSDDREFSFWMLRIGMPVIVGLLSSLVIALIFIPLATRRLSGATAGGDMGWIAGPRRAYDRSLRWILRHRLDTLIVVLLLMATIKFPMDNVEKTDREQHMGNVMRVEYRMPGGQKLERADEAITELEDFLYSQRVRYNIDALQTYFSPRYGRVQVFFKEEENNEWYRVAFRNITETLGLRKRPYLKYDEVMEDIKKRVTPPPGYRFRFNRKEDELDISEIKLDFYGENTDVLITLASEAERRLGQIPGIFSLYTDVDEGGSELQVRLDRERLRRYGLRAADVSQTIATLMRGVSLSRYQTTEGREIDIHMQMGDHDDQTIQQLRSMNFRSLDGVEIPLDSVAALSVERSPRRIEREDRKTLIRVRVKVDKKDVLRLYQEVDRVMTGFQMPRGYRWDKGSRYDRLQEADESRKFSIVMSVTFVFLLMGVLFESFILPLSVILSIPFSFLGVYWTLYLTNTPMDIMSTIGSVILIGVVVNNAIVLIDLANRLRAQGRGREEALILAGHHRFRPIMMTTFTTVFGLIPMAVGNAELIGLSYAPLGRTMMGGLLAATVLTLIIVPLFYTYFDDLRMLIGRTAHSALKPVTPKPATDSDAAAE